MEEQTGGLSYSVTEKDVREYVELVIDEKKHSAIAKKEEPEREANVDKNGNYSSS
jgi:hypothetical protein